MRINPELASLMRRIDDLVIDPANVRSHSPRNIDAIVASLQKFGQQKPIVINRENVVLAGNGTLAAAAAMGAEEIAALTFDGDSRSFEAAYAIADNRTAELAEWDFPALSLSLKGLAEDGVDLPSLGWDQNELDLLLKAKWDTPGEEPLPGAGEDAKGQTHGVRPVVISQDQRDAFDKACAIIRAELDDETVSEQRCFVRVIFVSCCTSWQRSCDRPQRCCLAV